MTKYHAESASSIVPFVEMRNTDEWNFSSVKFDLVVPLINWHIVLVGFCLRFNPLIFEALLNLVITDKASYSQIYSEIVWCKLNE